MLYLTSATAQSSPQTFKGKTAYQWSVRAVKAERGLAKHGRWLRDERRAHHDSVAMLTRKLAEVRALLRKQLGPYSTRPPHYAQWMCIHSGEGAWNANTGNGYYGGLQMDMSFQRAYGWDLLQRKGTANNWTPLEQMWVAEKAYSSGRGFYPWPTTARRCGLI